MIVDSQILPMGAGIRAGQKKDVVMTNRLDGMLMVTEVTGKPHLVDASNQVAIYGWHRNAPAADCSKYPTIPGLCPIQGLSVVHDNKYADYSHGIRMVSPIATLDGQSVHIGDILTNPDLAPLLSHEGVLNVLRQPHVAPTERASFIPPPPTQLPDPDKAVTSTGEEAPLPQWPPPAYTPPGTMPPPVEKPMSDQAKILVMLGASVVGYVGASWLRDKYNRKPTRRPRA
jgi:hypothetical protein